MAHRSEDVKALKIKEVSICEREDLNNVTSGFEDVCLVILPASHDPQDYQDPLKEIGALISEIANNLGKNSTLVTIGETVDLVQVQAEMLPEVKYQMWIALKRSSLRVINNRSLPQYHFGALIHTMYDSSLQHTKTRIAYTYCPVCNKTTKDYGGKKHTYHRYGTSISDIWRDIHCDLEGDISAVTTRFADLFGIDLYNEMLVLDLRSMDLDRIPEKFSSFRDETTSVPSNYVDSVLQGDCLEILGDIPDNSIDFAFADPPYNLNKGYSGYSDDMEIVEYFEWCDEWIKEIARVLKPGRTFALLNIPLWSIRHFLFLRSVLNFQNWIAWDALAFPVRNIMPAHYAMLCFSKGQPRELPGLIGEAGIKDVPTSPKVFTSLEPLAEWYCLRSSCVNKRINRDIDDRGPLTDLWWDIHRLKHNSRRVDHPCQLPPHLMYRILSIFTKPNEIVLDCFNGAGTTTLAAHQLQRSYIGIDVSKKYCEIAAARHEEINEGLDPFRKQERTLTSKNSPVPRLPKQKYEVPKKTLQLEVKRVAREIDRLPSRDDMIEHGKYPIEYYDEYFVSWGEVCAAARTTGMTENRGSEMELVNLKEKSTRKD